MAQHKLTDKYVKNAGAGTHEDGDGLRLAVSNSGAKRWVLRITVNGKRREIGLGSYPVVTLANARSSADKMRKQVAEGLDPVEEKAKLAPKNHLFDQCAADYISSKSLAWSNIKHTQQWTNTLKTYADPEIGKKCVTKITIDDVLRILNPIWKIKTETAKRVQSRIEAVLDYAIARKYRTGDNPARWVNNLDTILPSPNQFKNRKHHPAMPYEEVRQFMNLLADNHHISALALQFLILTACRTGEVIGAKWEEFHFDERMWLIPAERMKAGKEHRVPLSNKAMEILKRTPRLLGNPYVFSSPKAGKPLSSGAILMLMRGMGHGNGGTKSDYVPHGFRSSFRDWAGEISHYPGDVCEMALAHTIKNKVEAAYRRGDLLEKRRQMMEDWCSFITK